MPLSLPLSTLPSQFPSLYHYHYLYHYHHYHYHYTYTTTIVTTYTITIIITYTTTIIITYTVTIILIFYHHYHDLYHHHYPYIPSPLSLLISSTLSLPIPSPLPHCIITLVLNTWPQFLSQFRNGQFMFNASFSVTSVRSTSKIYHNLMSCPSWEISHQNILKHNTYFHLAFGSLAGNYSWSLPPV